MSAHAWWRLWWLLVLGALPLAFYWAGDESGSAPALVKARRNDWQLPAVPAARVSPAALGILTNSGVWGAEAFAPGAASSEAEVKSQWRLAGVFKGRDGRYGVVVNFSQPERPAQTLHVGDELPSGDKIVNIEADRVCVLLGKVQRWLPVFPVPPLPL